MPPPLFSELGRYCMAIFNNGYPLGLLKVDTCIRTCGNVNLSTGCAIKQEDWSMNNAEINTKYTCNPPRIKTSVFESWDLDNNLKLGVTFDDLAGFAPGIKVTGLGVLNPATGAFSGKVGSQAKTKFATLDLNYEGGDEKANSLVGSIVGGYAGMLLGYKTNYNMDDGTMSTPSLCAAYCTPTFQGHWFWDNWETYKVNFYHRIHDRLEAGVIASWAPGNPPPTAEGEARKPGSETGTNIAVGCRLLLTPFTFLRAKVDVDSQVGVGIESKIREGTTLTIGANIDGKNIKAGNHTFGLGILFEADFSDSC